MPRSSKADDAVITSLLKPGKKYKKPKRQMPAGTRKVFLRVPASVGYISGYGDYTYDKPGPWGKAGRFIGNALGSQFAGSGGGKLGAKLGSYLHYIGKIFGSGDYVSPSHEIRSNTLVSSTQIPQFVNGKHTVRIQHREFLGDVSTSATAGAFQIQDFPINPGLSATFPWLSSVVGVTYQQYSIKGMVFEFRSMSSDALNSTNTALGSVVMATDYDSTDQRFVSKAQMENTEFGVSCKPSSCMIHAIECARKETSISEQYIRSGAPPPNADIRLYDLGRFSIATVGMQGSNVNVGELWVSYDIEFYKPIQQLPLSNGLLAAYQLFNVDNTHPLGTQAAINIVDSVGLTFTSTSIALPYNLQTGTMFNMTYSVVGNSTASVAAPAVTFTHGLASVGNTLAFPASGTATTAILYYNTVFVYNGGGTAAAPPTIDFVAGVVPSANLSVINFTQINGQALNNVGFS